MYKNFNLTESEREQILNQHKEHGYKKPLNEQSYVDDMGMDGDDDLYPTFDGDNQFVGMSKPMGDMESDSYEMDELEEIEMGNPSEDETKIEKLLNYFGFKKYKVLHDGDLVVYDNGVNEYNIEIRIIKNFGGPYARILYHGPEFGNPDNKVDEVLVKDVPVKVGDDRFPMAIEGVLKKVKAIKQYNESKPLREGWRDIFGAPNVKDAARSAYKSQGHSMMGKDDEQRVGEYYMVFNGEKYFPNQIEYAGYQDLGELPRVENGMLIVPNPAWES
jgi:hypothetical protein